MRKKSGMWILLVSLLLLLMASCNSSVKTDMSFTETFFGERSIACTLDGSLGQDKIVSIEEIIKENCPPELTYAVADTQGKRVATFTLAFASEAEYRKKVEALIGRAPQIALRRTNTVFCQGVSYREDFTSQDLLLWFDKAAMQKNLVQEGQSIWTLEKPVLTFDGKRHTSATDNMEVVDMVSHPVDKIVVETVLKADGRFQRSMGIHIPKKTVDALGDALTAYLATLSDEKPVTTATGIQFSVSVTAATPEELLEKTVAVLDADNSTLSYEKDSDASTRFIDQNVWNESLDFSAFLSQDGKDYVNYAFSVEESEAFVNAKILRSGEWVSAPDFEPAKGFVQQGETDAVNVQFVVRHQQLAVTGVFIETNRVAGGSWSRDIIVRFDKDKASNGPEKLKSYIEERGVGSVETHTDKENNPITNIHLDGALPQLSQQMKTLFGEGNSLEGADDRLFFLPQHSAKWTENIDMSSFLGDIGYDDRVEYTLDGKSSSADVQIKTLTDADGDQAEKKGRQYVESISFPAGEPVQLTVSVAVINPMGLVMVGMLALVLILILVCLFIRISSRYAKPDKAQKKLPAFAGKETTEISTVQQANAPYTAVPLFANVDPNAATKTILLEGDVPQEEIKMKKKRGKRDQYANAKGILAGTAIEPKKKSQSTKQYLKEEKREAAERVTATALTPATNCMHCGEPLRLDAKFCIRCGKSTQTVTSAEAEQICPVCHHAVDPKYSFCNTCGTRIRP